MKRSTRREHGSASRTRLARRSGAGPPELRELIDTDLPADELERLARLDLLLRVAAGRVRADNRPAGAGAEHRTGGVSRVHRHERRAGEEVARPSSRLVTPPATTGSTGHRADEETYELKLGFGQLALIYKSLQAVRTLGALPPQDELLNDTMQLVDQALSKAI
jgi:hypothetical protein